MSMGSFRSDSAINGIGRRRKVLRAETSMFSSSRMCTARLSCRACTASSRRREIAAPFGSIRDPQFVDESSHQAAAARLSADPEKRIRMIRRFGIGANFDAIDIQMQHVDGVAH